MNLKANGIIVQRYKYDGGINCLKLVKIFLKFLSENKLIIYVMAISSKSLRLIFFK